jgi:hypothetical protein
VDYEITPLAPERRQLLALHTHLLQRLSQETGLRVNGYPSPLSLLVPPAPDRTLGQPAPVYARIGTRMEASPRRESVWTRELDVQAARIDAPLDLEGIVIEL